MVELIIVLSPNFIYLFIYLFVLYNVIFSFFTLLLSLGWRAWAGLVASQTSRGVFAAQARHLSRMGDWQWAFLCPHQKLRNPCPPFPLLSSPLLSSPLLSSPSPSPPQDKGIDKFKMYFTVFHRCSTTPNPFFSICISFNSFNCVYFCIYVAISRNLK